MAGMLGALRVNLVTRVKAATSVVGSPERCRVFGVWGKSHASPLSTTATMRDKQLSYKLLVVGGGTAGCATASIFSRKLGKGKVAVIEPSETHYYQPLYTLIGRGLKSLDQASRPMGSVLPSSVDWIKDSAVAFDPDNNTVTTGQGKQVKYEFLVCALGLQLNYHLIKGLPEALEVDPLVCSTYSHKYVNGVKPAMDAFKEGNAIFTFPNTPIKCAGAPQKILYLTEEYFRQTGKRDKANMIYNTSLGVIFGIKKYAEALSKIAKARNIDVNTRLNLIEVRPEKKEAVFEHLDTKEEKVFQYSMLHVAPPMSAPEPLWNTPLVDETKLITVTRETLQHTKYPNVFALGDGSNLPNAKTAAAVSSQTGVLKHNLSAALDGKPVGVKEYNGYTACPLVTSQSKCIMAEFDWNGQPMETFPFDQAKESRVMYQFKAEMFPWLYWSMLLKGHWHGPSAMRKLIRLGRA